MKIAFVYDRINKWGGAERILLSLHKIYPQAPIFTSVYSKEAAWAKKIKIIPSFIQKIPFAKKHHEYFASLMPLAFESFNFDSYDLIISVTSEAAKGIITSPKTRHICICLTPTRYLWSGYLQYFKNETFRFVTSPLVTYLRRWDRIASNRPDSIVAISENVRSRISKYYGRNSQIIYPPSDLLFKRAVSKKELEIDNYFLVVSRLVDYKNVDIAIKACNKLKLPLVIVGEGHEKEKLMEMAGSTIQFVGKVSDAMLLRYYKNCRAFIFPGDEDFGITMVEAQHSGKPVIALRSGGATEIILEGKTGVFFDMPRVTSLVDVLKKFKTSRYNSTACKRNAQRFTENKFMREIKNLIQKELLQVT